MDTQSEFRHVLNEIRQATAIVNDDIVKVELISQIRDGLVENGIPFNHANIMVVGSDITVPNDLTPENIRELADVITSLFFKVYSKFDARGMMTDDTVRLLAPQLQIGI